MGMGSKSVMCGAGLLMAFLLVACASSRTGGEGPTAVPTSGLVGGPISQAAAQVPASGALVPEYRLGFGDIIEVKFFGHEAYNELAPVRPDGRISLQKVGDVIAAGLTPSQVDSLVTEAYRQVLQEPEVTVIVRQFAPQQIYILGQVNRPGGHLLQRNMTVLQGLALAGGPTNTAKLKSVLLLRPGLGEDGNGTIVDLGQYLNKGGLVKSDPALLLQPQDVIYVPRTNISSVTEFLRQVYGGILPPLDTYIRILILRDRLDN